MQLFLTWPIFSIFPALLSETSVMDFLITIQLPEEDGVVRKHYRCDLCKKVGKDRSNMKRHMIHIHAEPSQIPCPYHCGKIFKNTVYLTTHVNSKICLSTTR